MGGAGHHWKDMELETDTTLDHSWGEEAPVTLAVKTSPANNKSMQINGDRPVGLVWLGGFKSDMTGTKAQAMVQQAAELGVASLRFDYSGHGASGGEFVKGTISRWVDETLAVLRAATKGPQILVGSSMGGWIALRVAEELAKAGESDRLAGLLLIAPAPDFTALLMEPEFTQEQKATLEEQGFIEEPSEYSDEPNIITKALIEDGRNNLVLDKNNRLGVPVRILQGMKDPDVPYTHAQTLVETLRHDDVTLTLIKDGDHRLSRDEDIALLKRTIFNLVAESSLDKL